MTDEQVNANSPKPERGPFQFGLRTLFVITAVFALVLGTVTVPYQRRAFEEKLRQELGGPVPFYVDWNGVPWWSARARRVVFHDSISDIKPFGQMKGWLNDEQLARVQPLLGTVEFLDLSHTRVTDVGLKHVAEMTQLTSLDLSGTAISDDGLAHLSSLASLRILRLWSTSVTDAGLEKLEHLSKLEHLDLIGTKVTDEGLAGVRKALPNTRVVRRLPKSDAECHAGIPETRRP
jgi:hypothetical protein